MKMMADLTEFKKFFLFNLIGSLIIAALVAVITVLIGEFNEITMRVFLTLGMVVLHSLISLSFVWNREEKELRLTDNALFLFVVISFFTSILGIWRVIPSDIVLNLYQSYFVIFFAIIAIDLLTDALHKKDYLDLLVYVNYFFIITLTIMLQLVIYIDRPMQKLGDFYFRAMAAIGIIIGTLSILTIIFNKIASNKNHSNS